VSAVLRSVAKGDYHRRKDAVLRRAWILAAGLIASGLALAADPDLFPLAVGNRWEYSVGNRAEHVIAEVLAVREIEGKTWFRVRWLDGNDHWLRVDAQRRVVKLDRGQETLWIDFASPAGELYETHIAPCTSSAKVVADRGKEGIEIEYPLGACFDAGLLREVYVPSVGLKERTAVTFVGPQEWTLVAARIGGQQKSF
jgi:hypothetical protein